MPNIDSRIPRHSFSPTHVSARPLARPASSRQQPVQRPQPQPARTEIREEKGLVSKAFQKVREGGQAFREAFFSQPQITPKRQFIPGQPREIAAPNRLQLVSSGVGLQGAQARKVPISGDALLIAALDNVIRTGNPQSITAKAAPTDRPVRPTTTPRS